MNLDPSNQEQLEQAFLAEAAELLQTIEQNLIGLFDEKTTEKVHALMRSAHTLKGSAASVGQETIKTIAHHLEDVFQALYPQELEIDPELGALLLDAYECLRTPLSATLMGLSYNEAEILDRTASIFAQLQHKLGDFFGREAPLPSSEELGFDVVESIFSGSVPQDLQQLAADIQSQDPQQIQTTLNSQAEFFAELAASYSLLGLGEIAQATLNALKAHPDKVLQIAQVALENFQAVQVAVLAGDRTQGGEISPQLREWAGLTTPVPEPQELPVSIANQPTQTTTTENQPSPLLSASEAESIWSFFPKRTDNSPPKAPEVLEPISQDAVVVTSTIDRILQSIWIGDPQTSCRYSDSERPASPPPAPSLQVQSSASLPSIRVAIEQLDRLSHTIGELLINENQQNLQSNHIHKAGQETLLQFLYCQQQLSKLATWSDRQLLPERAKQRYPRCSIVPPSPTAQAQSKFDALEMDSYSELHILLQNLIEDMVQLGERIEAFNTLVQQSRFSLGKRKQLLSGAQEDLLQARMVPLGTVLNRFPRLLQQMVATYHKPVELKLGGTKVLVDKAISELLYDPLLHMIRNAFDHGIEPIETRRQQGKPETGTITIQAYHQGNRTTIEVRDDGRGLNWESIRQRGIEKHLLNSEEAPYASQDQLSELLFEPGFSTANQIGELSGRGIGLDVVRTQLQALQGSIVVRSLSGQGTTFILQLPLSLTTARLLVCQSQGITYALLSEGISQVLLPQPDQIQVQQSLHGQGIQKFWQWGEGQNQQLVPIRPLANLLDYKYPLFTQDHNLTLSPFPVKQRNTVEPLLLLQTEQQYLCLQVDQILVEQELVIKSLGRVVTLPSYIQGYSVLGNGSLTLTIDPLELVRQTWETDMMPTSPASSLATKLLPAPEPVLTLEGQQSELTIRQPQPMEVNTVVAQPNRLTVLVVEDSIVQRQSLVQTLQKADYQVLQAGDGREAIAQMLQHGNVNLAICDIEMPRMNGFEFLEHHRQDERLSRVPVVMLTTRSGQKHRQLALALGAKAYLTKPYSEQNFLAAIAELVNSP